MSATSSNLQQLKAQASQVMTCFHCGEDIKINDDYSCEINGTMQAMCCPGCVAVAELILQLGLEDYYEQRTAKAPRPDFLIDNKANVSENDQFPKIQQLVCQQIDDSTLETELIIRGISCPACSWLCETRLAALDGVLQVNVNYTTHRATVRWQKETINLSAIISAVQHIGYDAKLYSRSVEHEMREQERKQQLQRIGLTAVLGMQVMMISLALYFGQHNGMSSGFIHSFQWINLFLTTPVLFISGQSFFKNAVRDLKMLRAGMDLAVALGLSLAYIASIYSTVTGNGEVYFDTIIMFVFFLSVSRYLEFMLRHKSLYQTKLSEMELPAVATRLTTVSGKDIDEVVQATELEIDDRLLIKPGEMIVADCSIETGTTSVNEAIMTGESRPVLKQQGDMIISGSINLGSAITATVSKVGDETVFASIQSMIDQARNEKPRLTRISDSVASYFITGVILIALTTIAFHGISSVSDWLDKVIAILIVCCPCALSLAMPTVYAAAIGRLSKEGVIFKKIDRLLQLTNIQHFIFDKTGTVTEGKFQICKIQTYSSIDSDQCLNIASVMEQYSEHPIAYAFSRPVDKQVVVDQVENFPGKGLSGIHANQQYYLGSRAFIAEYCELNVSKIENMSKQTTQIYLATKNQMLAVFELDDIVKAEAIEVLDSLHQHKIKTYLCSGDNQSITQLVAEHCGFDDYQANLLPEQKLDFIRRLQQENNLVAMIGDGVNDAPTLCKADVSFAMTDGADLAQLQSDAVLMNSDLTNIIKSFIVARFGKSIIKQNIFWAITYNVLALPIAISGFLMPWMAAIGMSISSLVVVINADRVRRLRLSI